MSFGQGQNGLEGSGQPQVGREGTEPENLHCCDHLRMIHCTGALNPLGAQPRGHHRNKYWAGEGSVTWEMQASVI